MTATDDSADFFEQIGYVSASNDIPEDIERDRWGRPMIVDPSTGEVVAYTRASSMAGYISNFSGLHTWQLRLVAQGVGHRDDLAAIAASLPPYDQMDRTHKESLQEVVDEALITAKAYEKANWGTAIHAFTDPTHPSGPVPERMQADVRSHEQAVEMTGVVRLGSEIFVVNDRLKVAGTLDAILGVPALDAMVVADTKTGKQDLHKTMIQVAIYRDSVVYDWRNHTRLRLEDHLADAHPGVQLPAFSENIGIYTHIPRGEGKTTMHPLALEEGRRMAKICADVREWQTSKEFIKDDTVEWQAQHRNMPALTAITNARTLEELREVYRRYQWCWNDRLDKAGQARLSEIGAQ